MNLSIVTKEMFGQKEMNIYQNESKEVFMTREQIGNALEYRNPRRAIKDIHSRNKERLNKFSRRAQIDTPSGKQETIIYNEKGIYEIIRRSAQPKADDFYDWVYDLLSKIRKGEAFINVPMSIEDMIISQAQSVKEIKSDVNLLKNTMRIDGVQEHRINNKAKAVVIRTLNGRESQAYKNMRSKVFSRFWRDFKNHFQVPRYGELPKVQYDEAIELIDYWQPDTTTRLEIRRYNSQQQFPIN